VDINSSIFGFGLLHEIDDLIETALDVFSHVIFQMKRAVLHTFVDMIVGTIICGAVDDVSDAVFM
jgi:hypothetical protein